MEPFRGLQYSLDRFASTDVPDRVRLPGDERTPPRRVADLTDLVCPPYDVIDAKLQAALLARHERNAVRLELNPSDDPHRGSVETLSAWRSEGTLEVGAAASVYRYSHARSVAPDEPSVSGILARVLLEPWGAGVRPHERTHPGPKADRLALLRATQTQLSPILALYFDRSDRDRQFMHAPASDEWRARDEDGLVHRLEAVEPDERVLNHLGRRTLFVADGHHRYETALAYQAEVRSDSRLGRAETGALAADWIMAVLVNAEIEPLEILPTHRILRDIPANALRALADGSNPLFSAVPVRADDLPRVLDERRDAPEPTFGLVIPGGAYLLVGRTDAVADRMAREPLSPVSRGLDLAVLHAAILGDRLGLDPAAVAAGDRLLYTRDPAEALARVRETDASAAILVRPIRLEQLAAVAGAGELMPQKSTYFCPKLLTGLVFNPLEE